MRRWQRRMHLWLWLIVAVAVATALVALIDNQPNLGLSPFGLQQR